MSKTGIVLGAFRGRTLRYDGEENILLVGAQRQGKGIGIIVPTLLELREHVIVIDVRGQTWNDTAGWRGSAACGGRSLRLQLTQPGSTRKNLLDRDSLRSLRVSRCGDACRDGCQSQCRPALYQ